VAEVLRRNSKLTGTQTKTAGRLRPAAVDQSFALTTTINCPAHTTLAHKETRAVSDQFDAHTVPLGLMVRSRDLRPARFSKLVRGVSNIASRVYPTCAHLMPISGKPEIGGPPHPSRRALRNACISRRRVCLRPPQDEADKGPAPQFMVDSLFTGLGEAEPTAEPYR
jgi:hypothetical protein